MTREGVVPAMEAPRKLKRVIVWFRRDLRVADNPALVAALQMAQEVVPVFIWAPEEEGQFQPGRCLRWWLHSSLRAFEADLAALGSRLVYARSTESRLALGDLVRQVGAQAVLFNHLYDPISMVRDNEVKAAMAALGVHCQSFSADILREPWELLDTQGRPYTCFESFWTAHCSLPHPPPPPLPVPPALPAVPADVGGLSLEQLGMMLPEEEMSNVQLEYHWTPGGAGAHAVLMGFLGGRLARFDRDRAKTDRNSTSRLSPHIHCGEVSVRHVYYLAKQKEAEWACQGVGGTAVADFLRQVGYREYSRYLSFHFPFTHERSLLEHLRAVPWKFDQRLFKAWRQGRTGYPLVDAGMRELWSTGWFHNRIRVVAASFLVKNLLLPWQWGLKHYWDAQLDADLESDALGWQYCAGCMADAHDFGYMMDLAAESKRFDPDGNYVRRWLPVLARLPAKYIHTPWEAPDHVLDDAGVELGVNYPLPVISQEQAAADLAKAHAVVLACQRGELPLTGTVAGPAGYSIPPLASAHGPFRPPTMPGPAGLGEQLWGDAAAGDGGRSAAMVAGPGGGGGRRRPFEGAADSGSGEASEEVQSNMVAMDELSEVHMPPRPGQEQQRQQAQQAQREQEEKLLRAEQAQREEEEVAAAGARRRARLEGESMGVGLPPVAPGLLPTPLGGQLMPDPQLVLLAKGSPAGSRPSGGTGSHPTATGFGPLSGSDGLGTAGGPHHGGASGPQNSTEAAQCGMTVRGQGATSPDEGKLFDTSSPPTAGCGWEASCGGTSQQQFKRPRGGDAEAAGAGGAAAEALHADVPTPAGIN